MFLSQGWIGYNSRRARLRSGPATLYWPEYKQIRNHASIPISVPFPSSPSPQENKIYEKKEAQPRKLYNYNVFPPPVVCFFEL